ncbi:MAG: class I SAM-dependent RNA methyltransferase [Anaerolineales bacterium]|nr:class I SAM-dependent RNA methyltransferase [Anaerolineales bacterium]
MRDQIMDLRLEKLVFGGDALGRLPDGQAVFVPFALPGELVRVRLLEERRGRWTAELLEVLESSPDRVPPTCRHYGLCGGCQYQHLSYSAQVNAKKGILCEQLRRLGKISASPLPSTVLSPSPWRYRNHAQFHLTPQGELAYVGRDGHLMPVRECPLLSEELNEIWPRLAFESGLSIERIGIRVGSDGQAMLVLESDESPELEVEIEGLSVVHLLGEEAIVLAGEEAVTMQVHHRLFRVSAGAFFQVNLPIAASMVSYLIEKLPVSPDETLMDIYCGVGLFSAFFAGKVRRLIGVEASSIACEDFALNLDEFDNVELYEGTAEQILPWIEARPQTVIVDPPRAGLGKRVLEALLALGPERIAYVSCEPSTLARDAARFLAGGYTLSEICLFDQFPQTAHIESISLFHRERRS